LNSTHSDSVGNATRRLSSIEVVSTYLRISKKLKKIKFFILFVNLPPSFPFRQSLSLGIIQASLASPLAYSISAYFSPLIGHDARIPFRYSHTLGIIQASLASALAQWSFFPLHEGKSARKPDEILTKK